MSFLLKIILGPETAEKVVQAIEKSHDATSELQRASKEARELVKDVKKKVASVPDPHVLILGGLATILVTAFACGTLAGTHNNSQP